MRRAGISLPVTFWRRSSSESPAGTEVAASPLRRTLTPASLGSVPSTALDDIVREYQAQRGLDDTAARLPSTWHLPRPVRRRLTGRSDVVPEPALKSECAESTFAHLEVEGTYPNDDVRSILKTDDEVDDMEALREIQRRNGAAGFMGSHASTLAEKSSDELQSMDPKNQLRPAVRKKPERVNFFEDRDTLVSTAATLVPERRYTYDELSSAEHAKAQLRVTNAHERQMQEERQALAPSDALRHHTFDNRVRHLVLKFHRKFPVNHMITAPKASIVAVHSRDAQEMVTFSDRDHLELAEARKIAAAHGMDLIQIGTITHGDGVPVAKCWVADAQALAMDELEAAIGAWSDPVGAYEALEVGFTGGSDSNTLLFKCREIAQFLTKGHPVTIRLTKFGTPREGFPVMEVILGQIKTQCDRLPVHYTAGKLRYDLGALLCQLMPSTKKSPLSKSTHLTQEEMVRGLDEALYAERVDQEIDLRLVAGNRADEKHYRSLDRRGLLWTLRTEGLPLRIQRRMKVFQGMLPKSLKDMTLARGDVNVRTLRSLQNHDEWLHPRENNIDQATRGVRVLINRHSMGLSEMIDKGDTEDKTHTLARHHAEFSGDAMKVGEVKEAMGLKTNRRRTMAKARGFSTMGVEEPSGY
jgi:translation initiation factor IF-3